jgi:hypothetical protein
VNAAAPKGEAVNEEQQQLQQVCLASFPPRPTFLAVESARRALPPGLSVPHFNGALQLCTLLHGSVATPRPLPPLLVCQLPSSSPAIMTRSRHDLHSLFVVELRDILLFQLFCCCLHAYHPRLPIA